MDYNVSPKNLKIIYELLDIIEWEMTFMEIIEDRHGKKPTIIASQLPVEAWHEIIGEQTIADAILDRLVHTAHRINIKGESMRKKQKNK